jgi:hypothetical protein
MGKSGLVVGAGLRSGCGTVAEPGAQTGDAVQPSLAAGGAQVGHMLDLVVGMRVRVTGNGAEEVKVDAVHGLRPIFRYVFQGAIKRGIIRIRKILGT